MISVFGAFDNFTNAKRVSPLDSPQCFLPNPAFAKAKMEATPATPMEDSASPPPAVSSPSVPVPALAHAGHGPFKSASLAALTLGALGVVYGDIGTSPLYAMKVSVAALMSHASAADMGALAALVQGNVLGLLSLIVWALILVVTIKYHVVVLHADNKGEGGILALMALALLGPNRPRGKWVAIFFMLGLFGTALLYGDGAITPALSVLSAVEGLQVAADQFHWTISQNTIIGITIFILVALFAVQRFGTGKIGGAFGPIMIVWFLVLAAMGLPWILRHPGVFAAFSPLHAIHFVGAHGWQSMAVIGSVFLVVTGGEALYADMGHFSSKAIDIGWFCVVCPCLLLTYFGQGAFMLDAAHQVTAAANPEQLKEASRLFQEAIGDPFYRMAPHWALYPLVALATVATIIASQALITGVYSITRQAIQLGYCPPMRIVQTSAKEFGQIYVPFANWALLFTVVLLVLSFRASEAMASAYGIAVALTMTITTLLLWFVVRRVWRWPLVFAIPLVVSLLSLDCVFLFCNLLKIKDGGWVPLSIGGGLLLLFLTWKQGRKTLGEKLKEHQFPLEKFLESIVRGGKDIVRVPGTAVFMTGSTSGTPGCLLHNLKHNKALHERLLFVTVLSEEVPVVSEERRTHVEKIGEEAWRVVMRYGFMESPDIPAALAACPGIPYREQEATFFLGRERIIPDAGKNAFHRLRMALFGLMTRNARSATDVFELPPNRVVELGSQVEL